MITVQGSRFCSELSADDQKHDAGILLQVADFRIFGGINAQFMKYIKI